ncbi:MAG: tetratricopeptide repeat protein [Candidatus Heimdallarchaeota archaeon]
MTGLSEDVHLVRQGRIAFKEGNAQQAIIFFEQALKLNSSNNDALQQIGLAYNTIGEYDLAVKHLERALVSKEDDVHIWSTIAQSYQRLRKYKKSIYAYKKVLEIDPENPDKKMIVSRINNLVLKVDFSK